MICVQADSSGVVSVIVPQPADVSACTMVLASPPEIGFSPWAMPIEDAVAIGTAIWLAWAIAFGVRAVARAISDDSNERNEA